VGVKKQIFSGFEPTVRVVITEGLNCLIAPGNSSLMKESKKAP
jgi:hypothetical protein